VGTYASTGLPTSLIAPTSPASQSLEGDCGVAAGCWDISQLNNGPGAKIDGFELSTQFPLEVFSENLSIQMLPTSLKVPVLMNASSGFLKTNITLLFTMKMTFLVREFPQPTVVNTMKAVPTAAIITGKLGSRIYNTTSLRATTSMTISHSI